MTVTISRYDPHCVTVTPLDSPLVPFLAVCHTFILDRYVHPPLLRKELADECLTLHKNEFVGLGIAEKLIMSQACDSKAVPLFLKGKELSSSGRSPLKKRELKVENLTAGSPATTV